VAGKKTYPFTDLGKRCRQLRLKRGLSQLDMVRHFEFSLSHYQKIERGELDARFSTLRKLADAYGVTLSEMLKGLSTRLPSQA
jgi:transcriptional regulator with XRE-family HTH domain